MGANVKTTCVCPYYVDTGMFEGVRSRILPILKPDYVVQEIIAAVLCNQAVLMLPRLSYLLVFLKS
jgi:short-subunit dehydrogenase